VTPLTIDDVPVSTVVERDRSATPVGFMLPDPMPERIAAWREWPGPELLDPVTGNHGAARHSYTVPTPWRTLVIDICVGNDKPRNGHEPWHMRKGAYLSTDGPLARATRRAFVERHPDADVTIRAAHVPVPGRLVAPGGRARFTPLQA